jgi:integrase
MLSLDMPSGLRRRELAGLKWEDFDFKKLHVSVTRSLVDQHVGPGENRNLKKADANRRVRGSRTVGLASSDTVQKAVRLCMGHRCQPCWSQAREATRLALSTVMRDYIQSMARKLGIKKKMSWHTFRHTFSSILKGNGEDVKVVQELLRHSTSRMTLDTYTQALGPDKRAAQSKVVGMIRPKERVFSVYRDADGVSV